MKTLLFVNTHWNNRGDEAAFRALLDYVLQNFPDWNISVMFKDKKAISEFQDTYKQVDYFTFAARPNSTLEALTLAIHATTKNLDITNAITKLTAADAIIYSPGGAVICDRFWFSKQVEYLLPFIIAKKHNIPIMVAAPSMGPFNKNKWWQNKIISHYLKTTKRFIVRENISREYLETIGIKAQVTVDSALLDKPDHTQCDFTLKQDKQLLSFLSSGKTIAMTVTDFAWHVQYMNDEHLKTNIKTTITNFITYLQAKGYNILFLPQLFGNQDDIQCISQYTNEQTYTLSPAYDTYMQQYIISQCYATIGMRYHSNIFSAKVGTPFLAISYEEKMRGFMETYNLTDFMLDIQPSSTQSQTFSVSKLIEKFEMLEKNHTSYQCKLTEIHKQLEAKANETANNISVFLTNIQ